jgi:hypothetical protein
MRLVTSNGISRRLCTATDPLAVTRKSITTVRQPSRQLNAPACLPWCVSTTLTGRARCVGPVTSPGWSSPQPAGSCDDCAIPAPSQDRRDRSRASPHRRSGEGSSALLSGVIAVACPGLTIGAFRLSVRRLRVPRRRQGSSACVRFGDRRPVAGRLVLSYSTSRPVLSRSLGPASPRSLSSSGLRRGRSSPASPTLTLAVTSAQTPVNVPTRIGWVGVRRVRCRARHPTRCRRRDARAGSASSQAYRLS